jgi:hypothetical protein
MVRSKIRKKQHDPIILLPKYEEEEEQRDLSWMIRDDNMLIKPVKKSSKRRKR